MKKIAPALFVSHGSPMNAIAENKYTQDLNEIGRKMVEISTVLVISAHWETNGVFASASDILSTYHDFRGFPQELFEVQYPVPGAPELIPVIEKLIGEPVKREEKRGLDHGAWSMLVHLFPDKNVKVLQLSMDKNKTFAEHLEFAKKLAPLREQNVLILASGNMTHNFSHVNFSDENAEPFEWAVRFDELVKNAFLDKDAEALVGIKNNEDLYRINHPTDDHFIPLLYLMGVRSESDKVNFPHMSWQYGTMSMRHILLN
jgi:4,5-DOPA dioxygenase extradiol